MAKIKIPPPPPGYIRDWITGTLLDPVQFQEHVRRLASDHELDINALRDTRLLDRLKQGRKWTRHACRYLAEAYREKQNVPQVAAWLLDNEYILEGHTRDILANLPAPYYRELPALASGNCRGLPRIYSVARELAAHSDLRLDEENITVFVRAYQSVQCLSTAELWAFPQMLRMVLVEGIQHLANTVLSELHEGAAADLWAKRLITANREDPNLIFSILAELTKAYINPSPFFALQLIDYLYDEGTALAPVQAWLERTFQRSLSDLNLHEKNRQTRNQIAVENAFTSLRRLALLDWKKCFEKLSRVEELLREDPAGVYPRMDFASRDLYRRAIEELHRGSSLTEAEVARNILELANDAVPDREEDDRPVHVGTYLIGDKRKNAARFIKCREKLRSRLLRTASRHHTAFYLGGIALLTAGLVFTIDRLLEGFPLHVRLPFLLLSLLPASQIAIEVIHYLISRIFPPRILPKMDFSISGIPDSFRTLVVVPMILTDEEAIRSGAEKLEIRFLGNKEANLFFALFSDFKDADRIRCEEDEGLLRTAVECIENLNRRHQEGRFFLLHRERKWSPSERKFIGWERKRGKLEELNGLITGLRPPEAGRLVHVGEPEQLANIRFVITLDGDTQLPHDTGRRMVETLAHPLNQARFDERGRVSSGYTVIQPRVSPTLPSTNGSLFSRLFSDPGGIDPYTNAVSDIYQDLAGEGSYYGKGIYDVRSFSRVLSGRFPEEWLLSHDLIEGAHVRVGLASDIVLYDEFPQDYPVYTGRQHRWIRGDWQIMDWIMPRVPLRGKKQGPNPLSLLNRWKVLDNLRRSLLAPAGFLFLAASWLIAPQTAWIAAAVVAGQLLFHSLAKSFTWATSGLGLRGLSLSQMVQDLLRVIVEASMLPYQACLSVDAVVRVFFRRLISGRKLLEWTSAQTHSSKAGRGTALFLFFMTVISLFSAAKGLALFSHLPENLPLAGPWLVLWFFSPLTGWLISRRPRSGRLPSRIREKDRQFLRKTARYTWRYFTDFVNEKSSWLPPDNYQVSHQNRLAMRTSPTNIGLWMTSVLGAYEFGYLTLDGVMEKLSGTMATIGRLERYEGHLLNWYDIQTLEPLKPHYVSTVDSGNLLSALWTCEQGLEAFARSPLLERRLFTALGDTARIMQDEARKERNPSACPPAAGKLLHEWTALPAGVPDMLALLKREERGIREIAEKARSGNSPGKGASYWALQLESQYDAWTGLADRYLDWMRILAGIREEDIRHLDPESVSAFHEALKQAPSLEDLARGQTAWFKNYEIIRGKIPAEGNALLVLLDSAQEAYNKSKWLAGETLAVLEGLVRSCGELSASINMRFLYNAERRLFWIGYNISEGRMDNTLYDLLASEARIGSYMAVARGDVPVEHWFAMSRPFRAVGRRRVLLSWTGTMFEYLMPLLFQTSCAGSLLDKAAKDAVALQIAYGRRNRAPWGISECGFGDLDLNKTYQYYAFGVPELGLKRGQAERVVIAPYASLLALSLAPRQTVRNLKRLFARGLLSEYGYYEALDLSRQFSSAGGRGVVVHAYMAHHQGMSFLSLANFLNNDSLRKYLYSDPRVRAAEPLLHERIPSIPVLLETPPRERLTAATGAEEAAPSVSQFKTPHSAAPRTQLLSNGRYSLMLTSAGGGYSRWKDFEITRWRADRTTDQWGSFCYIRDADSGSLWCNTYHPVKGRVEEYSVSFSLERAVFQRADEGIESETTVIVTPEDDVEIRRMTLYNRSIHVRHLELTSYVELALAPHNADEKHPAFNKMFIRTEAVPDTRALLASRRLREAGEPQIFVAHRLTLERSLDQSFRFETDRRRFIGRGRTLFRPMGAFQEPGNTQGFVLDPVLSLRKSVTLAPGQGIQVSLILASGESREHVLGLMSKYGDPAVIDRAMNFAWAAAQLELRLLHIQPDEARRFQQLASHMLYPDPLLGPSAARITKNRKGQSGLWPYGISGDLPIALVAISEERDLNLVRQMIQAHLFWRMRGLNTDLVILNEEAGGYLQPLREQIDQLIRAYAATGGTDRPGRVYLLNASAVPPEDLTLLHAAASVVLVAARGILSQQLSIPREIHELPEIMPRKKDPRDPSAALPFMELSFFNSLGGFTPDGREYAIYLGPDMSTPSPWINVIANPGFGTLVSETGSGFTWQGNSQRNRLTQWSNDPVTDPPSEAVYIRDEDTGVYWTPTASPIREENAYRARHGAGYTVFEHNSHGIDQELTVFVPMDEEGGKPVKLQRLVLRNDTERSRKLSVTYYAGWVLGEFRESSSKHVVAEWDGACKAMLAVNSFHPDFPGRVAFASLSVPPSSYTGDRTLFLGRNRSMGNPAGMERIRLSSRTGAVLDPCAALRVTVKLAPGESAGITCMLGQVSSKEEARRLVESYRDDLVLEEDLRKTREWWERRFSTIQVHTPELAVDLLVNQWLIYQTLACRLWGRSGFYQSGGAFGFRDQLQDTLALLYSSPGLARSQILLAASRQFKEGDVQHWWHPPSGAGIRSRISDDLLWLPYVTAEYVRITGDADILKEAVPFLDAPALKEDEQERFIFPGVSSEQAPLFEHCQRALARSRHFGNRGLPLMGTGDWNDGMNLVGAQGKGESVWLAWFMTDVLKAMAEMSGLLGRSDLEKTYKETAESLIQRIEQNAWDGEWYLRAFFDNGSTLGSSANSEARIDSLSQSWSLLSGSGDPERAQKALDSAWKLLVREEENLVLLLDPPFNASNPSPGYIQGYPPGVRENGGQYNHAALWLAIAMARLGEGGRAGKILRMLNPVERAREPESVWRYGIEPYVLAADVYSSPERTGMGGWSWYTGSAAWMYRAWIEEVLGLKIRGETMRFDPVIPSWWDGFQISYRHGEALYEIQVENTEHHERGVSLVELDGKKITDGVIRLDRDLVKHRVLVRIGG